ncbi:uncharacterized protein LOC131250054 [Magnolia sinica]|uniref:uncharacterized protein LOC131250054 n=1 Tax=Magnolia sinica TaxID=86752 RepID=UPI002659D3C3|nr:uncharacterized protein LOC131250054 [Magnolia sinica]
MIERRNKVNHIGCTRTSWRTRFHVWKKRMKGSRSRKFWMLPGTCLTCSEIHFKNIRFKSSTNRGLGSVALYGSKQYHLNVVPLTKSAMFLSPLQGNFLGRNLGSLQEKGLHHT